MWRKGGNKGLGMKHISVTMVWDDFSGECGENRSDGVLWLTVVCLVNVSERTDRKRRWWRWRRQWRRRPAGELFTLSVSFMNLVNGKARNSMSRAFGRWGKRSTDVHGQEVLCAGRSCGMCWSEIRAAPLSSSAIYASSWRLASRRKGRRWRPTCTRDTEVSGAARETQPLPVLSRTWCCGSTRPSLRAWGQRCGTPCGFLPPLARRPPSCRLLSAVRGCWGCTTRNSSGEVNGAPWSPCILNVWHISAQKNEILRVSSGLPPHGCSGFPMEWYPAAPYPVKLKD